MDFGSLVESDLAEGLINGLRQIQAGMNNARPGLPPSGLRWPFILTCRDLWRNPPVPGSVAALHPPTARRTRTFLAVRRLGNSRPDAPPSRRFIPRYGAAASLVRAARAISTMPRQLLTNLPRQSQEGDTQGADERCAL